MVLAAEAVLTGWYVGFVIALVVISAVVVLVAIILGLARRIGVQAEAITASLDQARVSTLPLWEVDKVNEELKLIARNAEEARVALGGMQ
ncbi:MAG: hypothetical protein M3Q48_18150 [Actinomycetota bacterium]|nr:hypothetical protein [Actinomycetota bacterium]